MTYIVMLKKIVFLILNCFCVNNIYATEVLSISDHLSDNNYRKSNSIEKSDFYSENLKDVLENLINDESEAQIVK